MKIENRNSPPKLGGVARRRFISRDGVVPKPRTTPSARNKVASRLFIDRAATPPNLGGEFLFGCFTTFGIILISSMRPFCAARSGGQKLGGSSSAKRSMPYTRHAFSPTIFSRTEPGNRPKALSMALAEAGHVESTCG